MFGLSLILAAKQTLGPGLRVSVTPAGSGPALETGREGHETGEADNNKSLINI